MINFPQTYVVIQTTTKRETTQQKNFVTPYTQLLVLLLRQGISQIGERERESVQSWIKMTRRKWLIRA